ncbi:hypothetical protein AB2M62_02725 [Sphingomonas sp. MMS12-HWE2-04]|uniref:hypothetical protein n=1 Tax=Sphingomonas sp. MMS12-HWE2-04 TaxID=3234199 RepID=UPI00384BA5E7
MAKLTDSYRDHAAKAQEAADSATLENVRERNQRAAQAWTEIAERHERTERARAQREGNVGVSQHAE